MHIVRKTSSWSAIPAPSLKGSPLAAVAKSFSSSRERDWGQDWTLQEVGWFVVLSGDRRRWHILLLNATDDDDGHFWQESGDEFVLGGGDTGSGSGQ